jgi:hypothetical protein
MRTSRTRHVLVWIFTLLLLLLQSCNQGISTPASTQLPLPTEAAVNIHPNPIITLASLKEVNDYPFYVMHYVGYYDYSEVSLNSDQELDPACSIFAALGDPGQTLFGRNFDWSRSPALLLFTDPPDGYAAVSMVDLEFIGIRSQDASVLADRPVLERGALLRAPSMPFDGMNEYGLAIGMASVPGEIEGYASTDPSRPTIGSIGIIRLALDHARNVDEAVELFKHYNIDFRGGPLIHYLLADRSGKAMLIEFYQGEMILMPNENPWHMATNHFRCIAEGDGGCPRYRMLSDQLESENGQLDAHSAMGLLEDVSQGMTQWSVVYNITNGEVLVAIGQDYENTYTFQLKLATP